MMAVKFDVTSTTNDVLLGTDLRGQRVLLTGVSAVNPLAAARKAGSAMSKIEALYQALAFLAQRKVDIP